MSCESGNIVEAKRYLEAYMAETADKPYPWAESRRQELEEYLKLTPSPEALKARLDAIREDKLRALKLVG
jgi:hypothetical protein